MHVACTPRSINNDKIAFPHMAGNGNGIGIGIEPGSGSGSGRLMTFGMQRLTNAAAAQSLPHIKEKSARGRGGEAEDNVAAANVDAALALALAAAAAADGIAVRCLLSPSCLVSSSVC